MSECGCDCHSLTASLCQFLKTLVEQPGVHRDGDFSGHICQVSSTVSLKSHCQEHPWQGITQETFNVQSLSHGGTRTMIWLLVSSLSHPRKCCA